MNIDLSLLKRLVNELENSLNLSMKIKETNNSADFIVEMAKTAGIAAGIVKEASLLVGDIAQVASAPISKLSDLTGMMSTSVKSTTNKN